jgi:bacterial microcompartment shell vertex protein
MFLAKVEKKVISSEKHNAYYGRTLLIVHPVFPDGKVYGEEWIAMDYVGAGVGDIVICGGGPGVAKTVFNIEKAPIRTLIMAIVDKIDYKD